MKVSSALIFIAIGVWLAYSYPDLSAAAFVYIDSAYQWLKAAVISLLSKV